MNVVTEASVDELMLNVDLATRMSEKPTQLHIVKGQLGYRVRLDTDSGWRMINYKNPQFVSNVETLLGLKITEENGVFHASIPGLRYGSRADSRPLAVALAALKVDLQPGTLAVVL